MALSREISIEENISNEASVSWSNDELKMLEEIQVYHARMVVAIADAKGKGPVELPIKPKRKLEDLFEEKQGKNKKIKKEMTCSELHNYLQTQLFDVPLGVNSNFFIFSNQTFEEMKEKLVKGYHFVKKQCAQSVPFYLQYGKLLNEMFCLFQAEKKNGKVKDKWDEWLRSNIGIGASFARKIKDVAFIIDSHNFPQFLRLGLSFSEVYGLRKQIQKMLNKPEFAKKWEQKVTIIEQHESQPNENN